MFGSAPTCGLLSCSDTESYDPTEIHMYIGGGIIGTILVVCIIVWLVRRA
jgi:O-antigen ligase